MSTSFRSFTALVILAFVTVGCAGNPAPTIPVSPQAAVAHHATTVLAAVTEVQTAVTAAATASPAFVPTARTITGLIEQIHAKSGALGKTLRAYDAATTIDLRRLELLSLQQQIAAIQTLLAEVFNIRLEDATAGKILALVQNVAKLLTTLSGDLASAAALGKT